MEEGLEGPFKFGPYPKDVLSYKNNRVVEYITPAQTDGLGTHSWLKKSGSPIEGVAMLVGETPDLVLLSVRLPPELNGLTAVIVHEVEHDAGRSDRH
jgi:cell division inhibitor SulA